jgi:osmotically-inducible protein OsmY
MKIKAVDFGLMGLQKPLAKKLKSLGSMGIAVCLIGCLLSGCIVAMVAGAASGLIVYDRRSVTAIEQDARIFYVIHTAVAKDPKCADSRVKVSVYQQMVLLVGQVRSASLRTLVQEIAQTTPNVQRVYNHLRVGEPIDLQQQSQDIWITSEVRSLMLTKKGLESGSIKVITEDNVVYLSGVVRPEQADLVVNVARKVNGVRQVVKMFQYIR